MKLIIRPSALDDLESSARFYNSSRVGLGDYFLDSMYAEIGSLEIYGGIHPIRYSHYRHIADRFPFAVYYKIEQNTVIVNRVMDMRRDPEYIKRQLEG